MSKITFLENERIEILDAQIGFPNFKGEAKLYNSEGNRNFVLTIDDPDVAMKLSEEGWNVKINPPRKEGDKPTYKLTVKVSFKSFPPYIRPAKIYTISNGVKTQLTEETVGSLDDADVEYIDMIIRPRHLDTPTPAGNTITAYLVELYATLAHSSLARRYAEMESPEEY